MLKNLPKYVSVDKKYKIQQLKDQLVEPIHFDPSGIPHEVHEASVLSAATVKSELKTFTMADGSRVNNPIISFGNMPPFNLDSDAGRASGFIQEEIAEEDEEDEDIDEGQSEISDLKQGLRLMANIPS